MPFLHVKYKVFNDRCSEKFNMSLIYVVKMAIFKEVKQKWVAVLVNSTEYFNFGMPKVFNVRVTHNHACFNRNLT